MNLKFWDKPAIDNTTGKSRMMNWVYQYGLYIAFLILIVVLSLISDTFLTSRNFMNILRQSSIIGIVAIGATFVIITGGIDLSAGSVLALSAVIACSFATTESGLPVWMAILIGLLVGTLCGIMNGFLISKFKVAPFIVTLAMMTIARGFTMIYTNGRPVINLKKEYTQIGGGFVFGIPIPVIIFIVVVLVCTFILKFTKIGRHIYAVGGNEEAAIVSGISITKVKVFSYGVAGLLAALGGIVLSSRVMTGQPVMGQGYELDAIAAAVIGGISLSGGIGSTPGTVIGVLLIGVIDNGLTLLDVSSYYQQVVKGLIIILAVLLDRKKK